MSDADQNQKVELNDIMLAMDVVDTLRHQQSVIDRALQADDRDRALIDKVRKTYASQGIEVTDEIIAEGVKALREERFAYNPPPQSFQLTLARFYVHRGRWLKRGLLVIVALLAVYTVYHFTVAAPKRRAQRQEAQALQELKALPDRLAGQRDRILAEAREERVRQQAQALYTDAVAAVSRQDAAAAGKGYTALERLYAQVAQEYQLRIVSRQGIPSGVWRIPDNNPNARNYYIIVEAVTADGKRLSIPITSEENGQTRTVDKWGLRVDAAVFDQVKRDKMDDGIIQRNVFGVKKRGYLSPQYAIPTSGGAITDW